MTTNNRIVLSSDHSAIEMRQSIARHVAALVGTRVVGEGLALAIVEAFLTAQFEGGRHAARLDMIRALGR